MKNVFAIMIESLGMIISPALEATFDYLEVRTALREERIRQFQPLLAGELDSVRHATVTTSADMRFLRLS
jgi:hypothetical protein